MTLNIMIYSERADFLTATSESNKGNGFPFGSMLELRIPVIVTKWMGQFTC